MTWPPPTHDTIRARIARARAPRYSYCLRCGFPWSRVEGHSTPYRFYKSGEAGCFPLCEDCWRMLDTPEARWPYYEALLRHWASCGSVVTSEDYLTLRDSVERGL